MRRTVYKYAVEHADRFTLQMPKGAIPLTVQMQDGHGPQLWALVNTSRTLEERTFRRIGTGRAFDAVGLSYVGTYQEGGGALIWHVFEELS